MDRNSVRNNPTLIPLCTLGIYYIYVITTIVIYRTITTHIFKIKFLTRSESEKI